MRHAIYLVSDARYLPIAKAQANFLADQWGCDVHVFVEDDALKDVQPPANARVTFHLNSLAAELPNNIPVSRKWPRAVFLRNYAPRVLADRYDRVLYLDTDVWSRKADPALWSFDLPNGLGAVADHANLHKAPRATKLDRAEWLERIGVRSPHYFNAGILLIDTAKWDDARLSELLSTYFDAREMRAIKSQDFLNYAYDGLWTQLSPRWNYQPPFFELGFASQLDPVFVHFCDEIKPWFFPDHPGLTRRRREHEAFFHTILRQVGVDPTDVAEDRNSFPGSDWLTHTRRRLKEGIPGLGREASLRKEWGIRRDRIAKYLAAEITTGRFVDSVVFDPSQPLPRLVMDFPCLRAKGDIV
ncbi:glycosyltransferase family 8 protein [Thioclava indica]|uniref:Uncharacterized protein n=1 Tax=Thioclava indica TaxID=1353528 RepID=A0A074JMM2_9RHOB|nr:glycosyltransferase [Thioclava indica]KEO58901.1 hypothetical protein DT23_15935 [Thioclava indica]